MSGSGDMTDGVAEDPGFDVRAGEYVLGTLTAAERAQVRLEAAGDPALAGEIAWWEQRLAPLADAVPPAAAPGGVWDRIAASLSDAEARGPERRGAVVRLWRSAALWRATTAASLAVAAAFATLAYLRPVEPPLTAVLTAAGSQAVFLAELQRDGSILIRPTGGQVTVASGRDLELWALPAGATVPVSLGVLPEGGKHVGPRTAAGPAMKLLVSLEPKGGSPSGAPTGPVVYAGQLDRIQ
jgi:anti-sigma-K factor RskA